MERQIHILILEDNASDAELMQIELRKAGFNFTVRWAQDQAAFIQALDESTPDIILAGYSLPGFDGMTALALVRQRFSEIPVIIVSGAIGEETAIETLKAGATDYVLKQRLSRLGPVVYRALRETEELAEHKLVEQALRESEEHYRTLFNAIDEGFCIIEVLFDENEKPIDYRFLEINPAFERQTGLTDVQGKRVRELTPELEEYWFEIYGNIALMGEPARFQNRAGQLQRWYDVYAFRFGQPENRQVAVIFNDITEQKQAEETLKNQLSLHSTVLHAQ